MLGFPSTTEVERRMPKDAFYRNMQLASSVKDSFVHGIEAIVMANSVQTATTNIEDGEHVHEILVMRIDLKSCEVPTAAIEAINSVNEHKKLFVCTLGDEGCLAVKMSKLVVGPWKPLDELALEMGSGNLDNLWDTLASQVVYDDKGEDGITVEERFARDQKIKALRDEIAKVETRCRKERQYAKKNELFAKAKKLKATLAELEKGL